MGLPPRARPLTWGELVNSYAKVWADLNRLAARPRLRREVVTEIQRILDEMAEVLRRIRR